METSMLLIWLVSMSACFASQEQRYLTIPVEGYETELQDLGQHVEVPETPVRVIKITKTVAVKVPVPYPVKVVEKVPYPIHVNKPYPVPVPQVITVPQSSSPPAYHNVHEKKFLDTADGTLQNHANGILYRVQEGTLYDHRQENERNYHGDVNRDSYSPYQAEYSLDRSPHSDYQTNGGYDGYQDGFNSNVVEHQ